jgi:hypothetical protein
MGHLLPVRWPLKPFYPKSLIPPHTKEATATAVLPLCLAIPCAQSPLTRPAPSPLRSNLHPAHYVFLLSVVASACLTQKTKMTRRLNPKDRQVKMDE